MSDIALFPVPLEIQEPDISYAATQSSLGTDSQSNLVAVADSSSANCAQRVLKTILTKKGSVPANSTYGSNLLYLAEYGYNPETINEDVIMILLDVETQCKKLDSLGSLPVTARLASIELLDLVLLSTTQLKITIGVTTSGGVAASLDIQV
jgi:hypothetical protein